MRSSLIAEPKKNLTLDILPMLATFRCNTCPFAKMIFHANAMTTSLCIANQGIVRELLLRIYVLLGIQNANRSKVDTNNGETAHHAKTATDHWTIIKHCTYRPHLL
jgi:hypothetical protein